ncbi:IS21 family transposase [Acidimicrobiaceae bacterium USS-CC1]|uniref:IS21 family transposase n=1 Tax=Acidiferrimicrobium australe TaxID=2664430 RepID=A0ABW9QSM6_9ACTN|nr:IS21 family transposase [Acidiferrimicrobium australe]
MEILAAYDLTKTYESAGRLAGVDPKTVKRYVELRDTGVDVFARPARPKLIDPFMPKIEELVEESKGRIRADVVHERLVAMGFAGDERTTRRAVAEMKDAWAAGRRRVYRPWIVEPGRWLQFDWGKGPQIGTRPTNLWCAWLAWSRFRVVIPTWDRTLPTVIACLESTLRRLGGAPTYVLTDNEKTVTVDHVAGIAVRHPQLVATARHYGVSVHTCVPFDPESKGGAEATVRVAKADLVPTDANLLAGYSSFAELAAACDGFCEHINARAHRETRRPPVDMLAEERAHLHAIPADAYTAAFGETRRVNRSSLISVGGVRYSVPYQLIDQTVWARFDGDDLVVVHAGPDGAREVARHRRSTPGRARIRAEHYPPRGGDPIARHAKATNKTEAEFLAIGPGAERWLVEAAATGASRVKAKMADAVALAKLHGAGRVDRALGTAALVGRFDQADLAALLAADNATTGTGLHADEAHSLQAGTGAWARFGVTP